MTLAPDVLPTPVDPRRYHEAVAAERSARAETDPVCLYLETTNRCNLLCTTCPRTYDTLEEPADMDWALFSRIVDQIPNITRVVLHGVGEPMLVRDLPRMIRHLKERGAYVLFNTNGTLLTPGSGRALIDAGLDELRVSLDAAEPEVYRAVRGRNFFTRVVRNVAAFTDMQRQTGNEKPRVSLWLTGMRETIGQLPAFLRLAHETGVGEVHLQRLVFFETAPVGLARPDQALFGQSGEDETTALAEAEALATTLGITFNASGATEPGPSLHRSGGDTPWTLCRRPWSVMYITANGRALPCCIAPFSQRGYESFTLGDATRQTLREIWNGPAYQAFRTALLTDHPPATCANCGLRWSL